MRCKSHNAHPWNLIRAWPADAPLAVHLDQAPGQPAPIVRIASPRTTHTLDQADPGSLRTLAAPPGTQNLFWLGYELGRALEPAARHPTPPHDDRHWPAGQILRCDWALCISPDADAPRVEGDARAAAAVLARCVDLQSQFHLEVADPTPNRPAFQSAVERVLDYIRAGDAYQVDLTHRITGTLVGSPRAFATDLFASALPRHGAYLETTDPHGRRRAIVSASPELFLNLDPLSRTVRTRPMKGTRPFGTDEADLTSSPKDRAELNMIVDLMRNDLGRVCRPGTVRVESPLDLERHAESVLQTTATVAGTLRDDADLPTLIRATFPPGSVTGAPKIRAMQIIEQLEPVLRGPYCGSIGRLDADGALTMSVVIRSALLTETDEPGVWNLDFPVGAGIVADSDPLAEWEETLTKADVLLRLARPVHDPRPA